jgi:hypothetical protein
VKPLLFCAVLLRLAPAGAAAQSQAAPPSPDSIYALSPLDRAERQAAPERPYMRPRYLTLTAAAGVSQWDLSGTGSSVLLAVRADRPLGPLWLLGELSVASFHTDEQSGSASYVVPEAQLQLQVPRMVAPYLGFGAGAFRRTDRVEPGLDRSVLTTSGSVGVRLWNVIPRAVLRAELRLRGIGEHFTASAAEWTGGIGWSF